MNHIATSGTLLYLVFCIVLCLFIGCGGPEDTELANPMAHSYDLGETDIYDLNVDELLALDVPENWSETTDPEMRSKYFAAQMLQQFGNTSAAQIVAEYQRKRALGISVTFDETIAVAKARYLLWPNASNRHYLETLLKIKLREDTDDPDLFAKLYREQLIRQHGDIPEVHIVVAYEKKLRQKNVHFTEDEIIAAYEAKYVLWPNETVLRKLEKYRKAKAEGTLFHLIDWDDDDDV